MGLFYDWLRSYQISTSFFENPILRSDFDVKREFFTNECSVLVVVCLQFFDIINCFILYCLNYSPCGCWKPISNFVGDELDLHYEIEVLSYNRLSF